jgi:hypothetical protein
MEEKSSEMPVTIETPYEIIAVYSGNNIYKTICTEN